MNKISTAAKIILFVQILLIFSPFIPNLIGDRPSTREEITILLTVLAVQFSLFTALLGFALSKQESDQAEFENEIKQRLPAAHIKQMRDSEFYETFLYHAKQAKSFVFITYLGPNPPFNPHETEKVKYYEDMIALIKSRPLVHFRRIVRLTPATKPWISDLVNQLEGCGNAHIRYIRDSGSTEMPSGLSVQIIDDERVWLVALKAHDGQGEPRDLYIEHGIVARSMHIYYDRLWDKSIKLLDAGQRINE